MVKIPHLISLNKTLLHQIKINATGFTQLIKLSSLSQDLQYQWSLFLGYSKIKNKTACNMT